MFQTPLVKQIINLESPLEMVLTTREYKINKYHNTAGDNDSRSYEISLSYNGGGSPTEWLVLRDKLCKALVGQSIDTEPKRCTFTITFLRCDAKNFLNKATHRYRYMCCL